MAADINGVITWGIGPEAAAIEHFTLLGLNANPAVAATIVGEILGTASYAPQIDGIASAQVTVTGAGLYVTSYAGDGSFRRAVDGMASSRDTLSGKGSL